MYSQLDMVDDIIVRFYEPTSKMGLCFNLSTIAAHWGNQMESRQHRVVRGDRSGVVLNGTELLDIPDPMFHNKYILPSNAMKVLQHVEKSGKTSYYLAKTGIIIRQVGVHAVSEFPELNVTLYELKPMPED